MDLATDPTLSEDAHFVLSVPWPASKADVLHYIGIADGVGSWRGLGVDPRYIHSTVQHDSILYVLRFTLHLRYRASAHACVCAL
jgi:hypothetical protein